MYTEHTVRQVLAKLKTAGKGLSGAEVKKRRLQYGYNEVEHKKRSLWLLFFEQFHDVMVYILLAALILSTVTPFLEGEAVTAESFLDSFAILAILILNAALGFAQEFRAEQAIEMLQKLTAPRTTVRRGGKAVIIPSRELLPGDIVLLEAGDKISADGRLIKESYLEMNESTLTGESQTVDNTTAPIRKTASIAEMRNMLFSGTLVTRGSGEYAVTVIGKETEIGKIAAMVAATKFPETPLQARLKTLGKMIGLVVIVLCAITLLIGVLRGLPFIRIFLVTVSLAVSAVPEGLPAVVTVCLAIGVRRMVKHNALIRRLDSLETLGSVTVICADKTGTITENKMAVIDSWAAKKGEEKLLATIGASCNRAVLPDIGDPTEIGLLQFAKELHAKRLKITKEVVPFTSEDKYMRTRHGKTEFLKGAPEKIVELCDVVKKKEVLGKNRKMAEKGLRVIACAVKENGTVRFVGLIGLEDPPRKTVSHSLQMAKQAGIRTVMITGDNLDTAIAIAAKVGIEGRALEGKDLDTLSEGELRKAVKVTSIYARVSPVHKVRILTAFQKNGEIVAMSGDGVNDAPALKQAHVGVAMGMNGTEVAREAASMVLADDDYGTIVSAIREGRRIYDNIRKFVLFLLRANFDEMLFIMVTLLLGMPLPYLPLHILWLNLMTDSFPALALGMEPEEPDIMRRPPRPVKEHILEGQTGVLVIAAIYAFGLAFLFFLWQLSRGIPLIEARTSTFTLAIVFELFLAMSTRSQRSLLSIGILSNRWMLGAITIPLIMQLLILYTPLREVFELTSLTLGEWGEVLLLAFSGFVLFEMLKFLPQIAVKNRLLTNQNYTLN